MDISNKVEILLLDSEGSEVNNYFDELSELFNVVRESRSETVIEKAKALKPVIIILDIDSEDDSSDRLACCKTLSSMPEFEHTPIVIATLNHSVDERIKGYEAGAYSYLEFPLDIQYLKNEINRFLSHKEKTVKLSMDAKMATDTALSAMVGSNELGQAIRFVEKTYALNDIDELSNAFINVTNTLNLKCVLYVKSTRGNYFYSSEGQLKPIETELLQLMHGQADRFVDINHRTLIFYPHISILIKNMPKDEPERYGRIKDLLPSMMGAADARVVSLDTEAALTKQSDSVAMTFNQVRDTLAAVAKDYSENQQKSFEAMTTMLAELDFHIPGMGLEEDQEEYLLQRIAEAVSDSTEIQENGEKLKNTFQMISMLLEHLSRQQDEIVELVRSRQSEQADQAPENDIELF